MTARGTITVTYQQALGLRESMRPLGMSTNAVIEAVVLVLFHERVMLLLVQFETTPNMKTGDIVLTRDECLLISQFLSMQDGDWAQDVLKQARRALHELKTGVLPGYPEATAKLFEGMKTERPQETDDESSLA